MYRLTELYGSNIALKPGVSLVEAIRRLYQYEETELTPQEVMEQQIELCNAEAMLLNITE